MTNGWTKWAAIAAAALWLGCSDRGQSADRSAQGATSQDRTAATGGPAGSTAGTPAGTTAGQTSAERRDMTQPQGEAQRQGATASSAAGQEQTVTGQVVSKSSDELVLKQQGQDQELKLKVEESTPVTIGGKQASMQELKEGTQVRASYDQSKKATRIEAQESSGAGSSRMGSTSEGGSTSSGSTGSTSTGAPGSTGSTGSTGSSSSDSPSSGTGSAAGSGATQSR